MELLRLFYAYQIQEFQGNYQLNMRGRGNDNKLKR